MSDEPMKQCHGSCARILPASTDYFYFYPSKGRLESTCKECRRSQERERDRQKKLAKEQQKSSEGILTLASPVEENNRNGGQSYVTVSQLAQRTGKDRRSIKDAIRDGKLLATKAPCRHGPNHFEWHITREDADIYVTTLLSGYSAPNEREEVVPDYGSPDRCGSCGTARGNILGDVDETTMERYGYVCAKCYRLVREFHADPTRLHDAFKYITRTRIIFEEKKAHHAVTVMGKPGNFIMESKP